MPRSARGGRGGERAGTPGKAYGQRSDLNATRALPATAATGQPYGTRKQQVDAQRAVPMARPGTAAPSSGGAGMPPRTLPPVDAATARPDEPLTAGISTGPGVGPEALGFVDPDDLDLSALAPYLPGLELVANQPTASIATRNFVRRLRGAVPVTERF